MTLFHSEEKNAMSLILEPAKPADHTSIEALYISAFPPEERAPYSMIKRKFVAGKADLLTAKDDGKFIGFAYLVSDQTAAYLFFFAVEASERGKGYGSRILKSLCEKYNDKNLFLAREQLDPNADNYEERVKRHNFYLHNGFSDLDLKIKEAKVVYDVMSAGVEILPEEYDALMTKWCGPLMKWIVGMKMFG